MSQIVWTPQPIAVPGVTGSWYTLCHGNGTYVALKMDSTIGDINVLTLVDGGATWIPHTTGVHDCSWVSSAYGNGIFVAVASSANAPGKRVMTSTDGVEWTTRPTAGEFSWFSVAFGNNTFVAVAVGNNGAIMTSSDGITWTPQVHGTAATGWNSVAFGNGVFVAVSEEGIVIRSTDGESWTEGTSPNPSAWVSVGFGGDRFFGLMNGLTTNSSVTFPDIPVYHTTVSADGLTWTPAQPTAFHHSIAAGMNGISYNNGCFVWQDRGSKRIGETVDSGATVVTQSVPYRLGNFVVHKKGFMAISLNGDVVLIGEQPSIITGGLPGPSTITFPTVPFGLPPLTTITVPPVPGTVSLSPGGVSVSVVGGPLTTIRSPVLLQTEPPAGLPNPNILGPGGVPTTLTNPVLTGTVTGGTTFTGTIVMTVVGPSGRPIATVTTVVTGPVAGPLTTGSSTIVRVLPKRTPRYRFENWGFVVVMILIIMISVVGLLVRGYKRRLV